MTQKTFKALYEEQKRKPTAAQLFVSEVAEITKRSETTVRMWLSGQQKPDDLAKSVIAEKFDTDVTTLFP